MDLNEFNKKCGQIASQQVSEVDHLVAEISELICQIHGTDDDIDWEKAANEIRDSIKTNSEISSKIALYFSLIGLLEVFRRMASDDT